MLGDRRRGEAQLMGGVGEGSAAGHGDERAEQMRVHGSSIAVAGVAQSAITLTGEDGGTRVHTGEHNGGTPVHMSEHG
ncbi:hypothetical protein GCM10022420_050970 [Streptomyces iranensis]